MSSSILRSKPTFERQKEAEYQHAACCSVLQCVQCVQCSAVWCSVHTAPHSVLLHAQTHCITQCELRQGTSKFASCASRASAEVLLQKYAMGCVLSAPTSAGSECARHIPYYTRHIPYVYTICTRVHM